MYQNINTSSAVDRELAPLPRVKPGDVVTQLDIRLGATPIDVVVTEFGDLECLDTKEKAERIENNENVHRSFHQELDQVWIPSDMNPTGEFSVPALDHSSDPVIK